MYETGAATDMAPTAADFKTAMTDSKRDPAGPDPEGVFGVMGVLVIVGGCERPLWFWDVAVKVDARETSEGFVTLAVDLMVWLRDVSTVSKSIDARGSSLILNFLTPPAKSSFCRDVEDGAGRLGCRAMWTVRPLRK